MFATALDSNSLRQHIGGFQYEAFAQENWITGKKGCNVNYIGCKPIGAEVHDAIDAVAKDNGGFNAWTRDDLQTSTMQTTMARWPDWKPVRSMIRSDAASGEALQIEESKGITKSFEHVPMAGGLEISKRFSCFSAMDPIQLSFLTPPLLSEPSSRTAQAIAGCLGGVIGLANFGDIFMNALYKARAATWVARLRGVCGGSERAFFLRNAPSYNSGLDLCEIPGQRASRMFLP